MATCILALEDGSVFAGTSFGAQGTQSGEVVFNTAMTGYQEILTDPSYRGQIVTMTAPLIGNYGINDEDVESDREHVAGFVVREAARRFSNQRAARSLADHLAKANVIGLAGIDTRALTRRLRIHGAMRGAISTTILDPIPLIDLARATPVMAGQNLVKAVAPTEERVCQPVEARSSSPQVVVLDCGVKESILRNLSSLGCVVSVVPPSTSAQHILESQPDGILVGNGPGDPSAVQDTVETLRGVIGKLPVFGICLGHQLLAIALGAKSYKLPFGHHGSNHPVMNLETGQVEVTSQNHGFAIDEASLESIGARVTHRNLYDQSVEGFRHDELRVRGIQHHPEAAPGPSDSRYVFGQFVDSMKASG